MIHRYTMEQREFIKNNALGKGNAELASLFNKNFNTNLSKEQMKGFKANNRISSGLTGRFETGHVPFNKDTKGLSNGGEVTQYRKGHKPHNYVPVGSERVNSDEYVDIKIADPNKWRGKHLIVWEQQNERSVPEGHAVIFGDGNKRNFEPDNLILLTRGQLAIMNRRGLIKKDADLTRTGIIMADLIGKISERTRGRKRK
ncbi:HNH endonuclease [Paenibacillus algorifonticola]|uniref:HNH endonuclease n=1 Tax=Paenibacillus algorifonticola TaxID=684063 RepID=A0A1I2GZ77_9BACL|nr:HNH endonuclease signature motif containing protein [Paenibacillus algorifonticola]SFF22722.1 HNH endonuclease [Paenibacillus algorifonticola]